MKELKNEKKWKKNVPWILQPFHAGGINATSVPTILGWNIILPSNSLTESAFQIVVHLKITAYLPTEVSCNRRI